MKANWQAKTLTGVFLGVSILTACDSGSGSEDDPPASGGDGVGSSPGDGDGDGDSGDGDGDGNTGAGGSPSGGGPGGQAGAAGSGGAFEGEPPFENLVPMFVATGHLGRSLVSCDDGRTWRADRAFDSEGDEHACGEVAPTRCNTEGYGCSVMVQQQEGFVCEEREHCDCTHHPGSAQGIAYGDGIWLAAWGWGAVASVRRTTNGVSWETVRDGMDPNESFRVPTYTGVAFGGGAFLLGDRSPARSTDQGGTFHPVAEADLRDQLVLTEGNPTTIWNARSFGFAEGVFLLTGSSGKRVTHQGVTCAQAMAMDLGCNSELSSCQNVGSNCEEDFPTRDLLVSRDSGESWERPSEIPRQCGNGDIIGGNGVILIAQENGDICYSKDAARTFSLAQLGGEKRGTVVFTGTHFVAWTTGHRVMSEDGETWESTPLESDVALGPLAYNPESGVYVSIANQWQRWYGSDARAYRSEDGVTWETLSDDAYPEGHSIEHISFGWGEPSEGGCPMR